MRWRTLHAVGGLASAVLAGLAGCSNEEPEYEKDEGSYQDSGTPPQGTDQNSGDQGACRGGAAHGAGVRLVSLQRAR